MHTTTTQQHGRLFLKKIISQREQAIRLGYSKKNTLKCIEYLDKLRGWMAFYPKATEEQVKSYIIRNREKIEYLIPGEKSPVHQGLINQLNHFCSPIKH